MITKKTTPTDAPGATKPQINLTEINAQKKALETKLEYFSNLQKKVNSLQALETHKEKIKQFQTLLQNVQDADSEQPKIVLHFGYRNEYTIQNNSWLTLLIDFILVEIQSKHIALETEIVNLNLEI